MDRPRFWGSPPMTLVRDMLPDIRDAAPDWNVVYVKRQRELAFEDETTRTRLTAEAIDGAEIVASFDLGLEALRGADDMKWLHIWSAGIDHLLYPEIVDHPVTITSAKGSGGIPMAEFAMFMMLMWTKNGPHYLSAQQDNRWDIKHNLELNGSTVGIIGMGNSGADLAHKCKAFHMRVLGLRRSDTPCPDVDEMYTHDRLQRFLEQCDFVVVTTPVTDETRGLLGEAEFKAMKSSAIFVVTSRGGVADDDALLKALNEGWIAGASLDAHTTEPLPEDSPFWTAPNAIVTPHSAAGGQLGVERMKQQFLDNLVRYQRGDQLTGIVNKQAGY
jgi:phosphoglycerate dehydrogenase-like enzyme